jgi:hypothetical protein
LRTPCSSTLFLAGFLPCFSWLLGTLQCCVLSHDTDSKSTGLLGCDSWVSRVLFLFPVTPVFPKKTKCKPICMPGSSFMHIADKSE